MRDRFKRFNSGRAVLFLVALIALFMTGAVIKITAVVILPFTIALLLALVLTPVVNFLGKIKIPRFVSILLVVIMIITGLSAMGAILFTSVRSILSVYPRYENRITIIYLWLGNFFELPYDEHLSIIQNLWAQLNIRNQIQQYTLALTNASLSFLMDAVLVTVFMVFLLIEGIFIKEKISVAFEKKWEGHIRRISTDIIIQISHYLSIKFIISLGTGAIVFVLLSVIGVQFAALWGIMQFVLNFIPTIGSIVIGVVVSLFALIQFWPDPGPVIWTVTIMFGVNFLVGNVLEPKIMGDRLGLSPIAILFSLVVWGWMWGFAGMIIAVPLMAIIKIVCGNISVLEPVSILLSSRHAVLAKKAAYEKEAENEKAAPEITEK